MQNGKKELNGIKLNFTEKSTYDSCKFERRLARWITHIG